MTGPIVFRPGRTAPDPDKPRLLLADHLDTTRRVIPDSVDYITPAGPYGMDGNDQWGDCALADPAHHLQSVTAVGSGVKVEPSEDDVVSAYGQVTGFRKDAGPPGQNPTDRGSNMQAVQSWWRRHGLYGHRTVAFAEVNVKNLDEVCAAIDLFGGIDVGMNVSRSAMDQFNAGQRWDVVPDDGGDLGGHAIHVGGYDRTAGDFILTSWGRVHRMTFAFWREYVEEAWAPLLASEWAGKGGRTPTGLDLPGLGAAFAELTGSESPFPAPDPAPGPSPQPSPNGLEVLAKFMRHLVQEIESWLQKHGL